jgi:integrase
MPRRAGTLIARGTDTWVIRLDLGTDATGKRIRLNRTIHGKKKDAERLLNKLLRDRDTGNLTEASRQPLTDYLDHWLATAAAPRLRPATLKSYREQLHRYIVPTIGSLRLHQVTPVAIQGVYAGMLERGLSARTVRYAHAVLRSALQQAVKWLLLPSNPADAVDLPKQAQGRAAALTEAEAARFLAAVAGREHHVFFALLLGTGLRPGEALALRWSDLDLGNDVLRVSRGARKVGRAWLFSEPKTAASRRSVDIPTDLSTMLAGLPRHYELVFANADGDPVDYRGVVQHHFKPALERAGLPSSLRVYDLRHTHATLLLLAGVHPKIVSERLGHADISLTLNTYSHVLPGMQREGAAKLNAMLFAPATGGAAKEVN